MGAEPVDVLVRGDEIGEGVSLVFVFDGELENDSVNVLVGVGVFYFGLDVVGGGGEIIDDFDADVGAIGDFQIDIFGDDWAVVVADDEEGRLPFEGFGFVGLTLFDKSSEFAAV